LGFADIVAEAAPPAGKSLVRITISPEPLLILAVRALLISSSLDGAGDTVTLALSTALSAPFSSVLEVGAGSDAIAGCICNKKRMASIAGARGLRILFFMQPLTALFAFSFKKN
jgi:hypothetical protein